MKVVFVALFLFLLGTSAHAGEALQPPRQDRALIRAAVRKAIDVMPLFHPNLPDFKDQFTLAGFLWEPYPDQDIDLVFGPKATPTVKELWMMNPGPRYYCGWIEMKNVKKYGDVDVYPYMASLQWENGELVEAFVLYLLDKDLMAVPATTKACTGAGYDMSRGGRYRELVLQLEKERADRDAQQQ